MKNNSLLILVGLLIVFATAVVIIMVQRQGKAKEHTVQFNLRENINDSTWVAPNLSTEKDATATELSMITYGRDLIAHTAKYFGPNGSISQTTNGMNCQNCHLDGGTRAWGNNFSAVFATYPQYRGRSNSIQDIFGRVNDCFQRSLNGKTIAGDSYEMQSIYAYIKWLGKGVTKGKKPYSSGLPKPALLDHAANATQGKIVYLTLCQRCHGHNGEGLLAADKKEFIYPPLWGAHSYNDGAGLFRLSSFASFVLNNMPYNEASHKSPKLTTEEAWNVAAFVNSQPRPNMDQSKDWPDVTKKPFDAPYGPYADTFTERQHKYGPFKPIVDAGKAKK